MRRALLTFALTVVLLVIMGAPALAHVCFVADKPEGAGSAGTATLLVEIDVVTGDEVVDFIPGPDLKINPKSGRIIGGYVTTTVILTLVAEGEPIGPPIVATADLLSQNTVGGHAHFAGPSDSGCDGVGMESLEACFLEALGG